MRRFDRAYIEVPKKNGKTFTAAGIGIKQAFFDGEPGSEVYSIATMRDQAARLSTDAQEMVKASSHLKSRIKTLRSRLVREETQSFFQPLSKDSNSADGVNPYCVLADELHRHKDDQLINVMVDSMSARDEPLIVEITTAGVGRESVGWAHHKYGTEILEQIQENDSRFVFIAGADEEDKENWQDKAVWIKANPNWGVSVNPSQIAKNAKEAAGMPSKLNDFLRYHLNLWVEQYIRWLPMGDWDDCPAIERDLIGCQAFGGLDLAKTRDIAAYVLVFPDNDGFYDLKCWFWMPKEGLRKKSHDDHVRYDQWVDKGLIELCEGNVIDQNIIGRRILDSARDYDIQQIGYDPWNAQKLALELQDETPIDTIIEVPQNFRNLAEPTIFLETLIKERKLRGGVQNAVLRWMAANSSVRKNDDGHIKIDKKGSSSKKIDGMVALILALGRAIIHRSTQGSIYDNESERPEGLQTF